MERPRRRRKRARGWLMLLYLDSYSVLCCAIEGVRYNLIWQLSINLSWSRSVLFDLFGDYRQ